MELNGPRVMVWVMLSGLQIFRVKHSHSNPVKKNNSSQKETYKCEQITRERESKREKGAEAIDTPGGEKHWIFSWWFILGSYRQHLTKSSNQHSTKQIKILGLHNMERKI